MSDNQLFNPPSFAKRDTLDDSNDKIRVPSLVVPLNSYPLAIIHGFSGTKSELLYKAIGDAIRKEVPSDAIIEDKPLKGKWKVKIGEQVWFVVRISRHESQEKKDTPFLVEFEKTYGDAFIFAEYVNKLRNQLKDNINFEPLPVIRMPLGPPRAPRFYPYPLSC